MGNGRDHLETATDGRWAQRPANSWFAKGIKCFAPSVYHGALVVVRGVTEKIGVRPSSVRALPTPAGIMVSTSSPSASMNELESNNPPVLEFDNPGETILALGHYARNQMSAIVVRVTESSGKTAAVAMLADALETRGEVYACALNANLSYGVAWNLSSTAWGVNLRNGRRHCFKEKATG